MPLGRVRLVEAPGAVGWLVGSEGDRRVSVVTCQMSGGRYGGVKGAGSWVCLPVDLDGSAHGFTPPTITSCPSNTTWMSCHRATTGSVTLAILADTVAGCPIRMCLGPGEVGVTWYAVADRLVGADGVVDLAEAVGFHREGVPVVDGASEQVLVFKGAEESFDDAVGLR